MRVSGPGQPAHLLLDIVDVLDELGVPYAVTGAFAVSFYGLPRHTDDADAAVWLKDTGKSAQDLLERFTAAGYRTKWRRGDIDDPIFGVIIVEDEYENRVDLVIGVAGMDPDASARCVSTTLIGSPLRVLGIEDLIAMKVFAGGVQDLEDVRGILHVSGEILNLELLRRLALNYGDDVARDLDTLLEQLPPTPPHP